jgi:dinuclear metal center YbgI/SA1388 family protein
MTIKTLLNLLNTSYPFKDASSWDNVGLILGSKDASVRDIFVSLDITMEVVEKAVEGSVIITHHPLIFQPLKTIDFDSYQGKIIQALIQKNISYIVLHTNYDKHFLNRYFIEKVLCREMYGDGEFLKFCNIPSQSLGDLRTFLAKSMSCSSKELKIVGDLNSIIQKVGVVTGSGSSCLKEALKNNVDILLTGDITYHTAMEARELGLNLIDITHYHSEKWFGVDLVKEFNAIPLDSGNPFQ